MCKEVTANLSAYQFLPKTGDESHKSTADIPGVPLLRNLFFPCPEEIKELERILNDDIYAQLMNAIGMSSEKRDAFKKSFFRFLYRRAFSRYKGKEDILREDGTWGYKRVEEPVRKAMTALLPSIVLFLDLCKCQPGTLKYKGHYYKYTSHAIQSIESQIMLECCANLWKKYPKMFLVTVHDCIKCLPKDTKKVEEELKRIFETYHVSAKFDVKHHVRPNTNCKRLITQGNEVIPPDVTNSQTEE